MMLVRALVLVSIAAFAVTGVGYLIAPGMMLSVVGIDGTPTEAFLIRTEGVALITAAGLLWATRGPDQARTRVILVSLATYYLLSSTVDTAAFRDGLVGSLAVPSVVIRVAVGCLCLFAAARANRTDRTNQPRSDE